VFKRRLEMMQVAFDPGLVKAAAALIRNRWSPSPFPEWVTCVRSLARPELVPGFARALADELGLPFVDVVQKVRDISPQAQMENSAQQLRNVYGAFSVVGSVSPDPVLLVDDLVDSRWTLTVIGVMLRHAGSGPVFPFVLARAGGS
jgi:ATP-dependent DNA helicase RecQ